jgi:hypothetical protein
MKQVSNALLSREMLGAELKAALAAQNDFWAPHAAYLGTGSPGAVTSIMSPEDMGWVEKEGFEYVTFIWSTADFINAPSYQEETSFLIPGAKVVISASLMPRQGINDDVGRQTPLGDFVVLRQSWATRDPDVAINVDSNGHLYVPPSDGALVDALQMRIVGSGQNSGRLLAALTHTQAKFSSLLAARDADRYQVAYFEIPPVRCTAMDVVVV